MSATVGGGGTGVGTGGQEEDKKPMDQSAHINLKVKGQDGNEVFFRSKRSTQLRKLMTAYCERQSVEFNSIAFLFDGRRLRGEQNPDEKLLDGLTNKWTCERTKRHFSCFDCGIKYKRRWH